MRTVKMSLEKSPKRDESLGLISILRAGKIVSAPREVVL